MVHANRVSASVHQGLDRTATEPKTVLESCTSRSRNPMEVWLDAFQALLHPFYRYPAWTCILAFQLGILIMHASSASASSIEDQNLEFFRELTETRNFTLGHPTATQFTPDGQTVLFLSSSPKDPTMRLFECSLRTGVTEELLGPERILAGDDETLSSEEKARRERARVNVRGIVRFEQNEEGSQVLVSLSGELYIVSRADKKVQRLPSGPAGWLAPRFSPDGKHVAAVSQGNLYVITLSDFSVSALTHDASDAIAYGLAEFIAQEEMDRMEGFWWSPDSERIAFQQTDESPVETLYIMNPAHPEKAPAAFRYPRAGTSNAEVRLGVISRKGGDIRWIKWPTASYPYLAQVVWKEKTAPLSIVVQTRQQREVVVFAADHQSGDVTKLLTETDSAWVDLDSDNEFPKWLADGSGFFWSTERRGRWQLELRNRDGKLRSEVTPPEFGFDQLADVNPETRTVIVEGGTDPREQHLYEVRWDGSHVRRLTNEPGWHSSQWSKDHTHFIHHAMTETGAWTVTIHEASGKHRFDLPSQAHPLPFQPRVEYVRVGSPTTYDAMILRPRTFDPKKRYPVIVYVYGGPGKKMVVKVPHLLMRTQWLADHGYIVVTLDGRGTPGYGRSWGRAIQGNLIKVPLEDQVRGLQLLGAKYPEMDMNRVGITGWSFGGYVSAQAVLLYPDVFRCGVAGAPVTDFRDYDTHYTERYMDLPSVNTLGYREASAMTYAKELVRPLLLIHGLTDDNVYVMHTLKLADTLFHAGRPFDLLPLSGTHMISDPNETLQLWLRIKGYFDEHLQNPAN